MHAVFLALHPFLFTVWGEREEISQPTLPLTFRSFYKPISLQMQKWGH